MQEDGGFIYVNVCMSEVPLIATPRPHQVELPHPIYGPDFSTRAVLFVKDPEEDFKEKIEDLNVPSLAEVIGLKRLRDDFRQFKDKRSLATDYDIFFTDIWVYKMLPKLLGREFYEKKKYPFPVKLHKAENLEEVINELTKHTYFIMGNGPNYALRIGWTDMNTKEIAENVVEALP
jgi:ribosome biogenesis protein UTP30